MQNVKLKQPLLIETTHHKEGDVVRLADARATALIRGGFAEKVEGAAEVANPGVNPLADAIEPAPPGGANASFEDAALPALEEYPGLQALENAAKSGAPRRAAKITGKSTD